MAIRWNRMQFREVTAALQQFPAHSDKCAAAARRILPIARQLRDDARGIQLSPIDGAPYLLPIKGSRKFYHHIVVEVVSHRVDALTGASGHPSSSYLATFFQYPDGIAETSIDVDSIDPGIQSDG